MNPDYPYGLTDDTGHPIGPDGKRVGGKKAKIVQEVMDSVAATITQQFERRIAALEAHITDLEERLNDRGIFSGDPACNGVLLCDSDCPTHGRQHA